MRTIARTLLACVLLTSVAHAGSDWNSVDFDFYPGDFNGDSKTDLLYVAVAPNKESGIALSNGTQPVGRHQAGRQVHSASRGTRASTLR